VHSSNRRYLREFDNLKMRLGMDTDHGCGTGGAGAW
jgi:hypothetical protein